MFKKKKQTSSTQPHRRQVQIQQPRSTAVFSYYANRSNRTENVGRGQKTAADTEPRVKGARRKSWVRRTAVTVGITAGLGLLVSASIVSPQPHITVVGDEQQQAFLQDNEIYRKAAQRIIADSLLNRNKLTFNASDMSTQMRDLFPELEAVTVTLPVIGWEPTVHVQAFTPSLVLIGAGTDDFVLDSQGRAFAPGSLRAALNTLDVPVVRDESGLSIEERRIALPSDQVAFITEVYDQLQAKGVEVTSMTLPAGQGELEARVKDAPYTIRFNLYGDAREGAGRYLATKAYLESHRQTPATYVDVRVDGRVYYR